MSQAKNNGFFLAAFRKISSKANRMLAPKFGQTLGYILDSEYPKAGGTWFGKMAAEILQLPYPEHNAFPTGCPCVLHNHWHWAPGLKPAFYLRRDGRDVMVSLYFHRIRELQAQSPVAVRRFGKRYEKLFGKGWDPDNTIRNLPLFIKDEFARPRDSRKNWRDHVMGWHDGGRGREGVVYLSYEELLKDAPGTMTRVITEITGAPPDPWLVAQTTDKYDMSRQTGGRKAGDEDRSSFIRKGVAGDWVNHFTKDTSKLFHELAGDALLALGYEKDPEWWKRVDVGED